MHSEHPTSRLKSPRRVAVLLLAYSCFALPQIHAENRRNWDVSNAAMEKRMLGDVRYLSSDELEGRGLTTKGLVLASEHIANVYREAGLQTDRLGGKPFHVFNTRTWLAMGDNNSLTLTRDNGERVELQLKADYAPISIGAAGEVDFPIVFAGYGITDSESGYDDFSALDVKDKAAIILRREPRQDDPDSPFAGTKNSQHAYLVRKIQNAADHGARMVLLCNDHHSLEKGGKADALLPFSVKSTLATRPVPVAHITRAALAKVLGVGKLAKLESQIDQDLRPHSLERTGWRVSGRISITRKGNGLRNVVGVLEPAAQARETLIVGAHYDHLGRGGSGSLAPWTKDIHNGADDNASGTSVLLEVARQVAARRGELKRRVVFIAFSAEESGLIGSARYVRTPLHPMRETAAMVNLDMVGRLTNDKLTVYGTGTGVRFSAMTDRLGQKYALKVKKISSGYGPSDHASFHRAGVPVLHLFTGLHKDYHRPSDDYDKLNLEGMRRIAQMTVEIVMEIASSNSPTRKPKQASKTARPKPKPGDTTLGVSVVDSADGKGCLVTSVQDGGPAKAAGIRKGDVILQLDASAMTSTQALKTAVGKHKPKDRVSVQVQRGALMLRVDVVLEAAK